MTYMHKKLKSITILEKIYISEYFQKQRERNDNENITGKQMCIPIDICNPKNNYNKITINGYNTKQEINQIQDKRTSTTIIH